MSRRPDYIPPQIGAFNTFQSNLLAALTTNAVAWGILPTLLALFTQWSTDYAVHYAKVSVKDRRTKEDLDNYKAFLVGYVAFLRGMVQSSVVNNQLIPIGTRGALGLNPRGLTPRQPKEKITTTPIVKLIPLGGGLMRFNFKVDEASKIAHMHPDSNGIAIYYRFSTIGKPAPVPPPQTNGLGAPVGNTLQDEEDNNMDDEATDRAENGLPTADGYQLYVSTKAQFSRQFALEDIGKVLHIYAQWINSSKPQNNGNFSMVTSSLIS
jgi:hypothetical protein